ncbi:MAG: ABC transporter permease [Candidatus Cohnella colombiensis]|uniref:ABC transporter permease n=1 Tax=Candidatus Cohnella colombiensis TaxID=3121368 RepID=A0AA95EUV0_9BACL|nr:MAG: ABC transporter permease [Cohnella sp.]
MNEGGEHNFLRSLRHNRAAAFRKEIVPYFRYVFQSGFGLLASAVLFAFIIWYVDFIKAVPANWPIKPVAIIVLALVAIITPLRTYFQPADTVFLLPLESRLLSSYIKPIVRTAMWANVMRMMIVWAIVIPIYLRSPATSVLLDSHPIGILTIGLAIIAGGNVYGAWRERQPASQLWRTALRIIRWLLTIAMIAAILLKSLWIAVIFIVLSISLLFLLWSVPKRHALPWERLVEDERSARHRWMAFLSWFVDVQSEGAKATRRRWIAWLGDRVPFEQKYAWKFLYTKTFLRSETFGAYIRWLFVAGFVMVVVDNEIALLVCYGIALIVAGMQLGELGRVRFVETVDTLPISPDGRLPAAASVARVAGLCAAGVLAIVMVLAQLKFEQIEWLIATIIVGFVWTGWLVPRKIAKRTMDDED